MKKISTIILSILSIAAWAQPCVPNTNSLSFNGTSAYVGLSTDAGLSITDSITVEAWIYSTSWALTSAEGSIFCHHSWTNGEAGYVLRAGDNGTLSFNFAGLDTNGLPTSWKEVLSTPGALTLNTWHHVAGTFDGQHQRLYINGLLVADSTFAGTILPSSFPARIGMLSDAGQTPSRYWSGLIDEVRVWNRALSQAEIQSAMSMQIVPSMQNGLAGYWRFNEGSGTTAADSSINSNNGTLFGPLYSTNVPFNNGIATPFIVAGGGTLYAQPVAATYQWYWNGNLILNATQSSYTPTQNGSYTVVTSNLSGCTATSAPYVVTSVGINEINMENSVMIYPNPVHGLLSVHCTNANMFSKFEITDIAGRILLINNNLNTSDFSLSLADYAKGIYFIKLTGEKGIVTKKILVD